jgi:hypothetical protein
MLATSSTAWARAATASAGAHGTSKVTPPRSTASPLCLCSLLTNTPVEITRDAYQVLSHAPCPADMVRVKASSTHRFINTGFAPVPLAEAFPLFSAPT